MKLSTIAILVSPLRKAIGHHGAPEKIEKSAANTAAIESYDA
jgi:hypothetical protein